MYLSKKELKYILLFIILIILMGTSEIIENKKLFRKEYLLKKDYYNISSTLLEMSFIFYTSNNIILKPIVYTGFFLSMNTTLSVVLILKDLIKKERPDKSNNKSFPSGHTAIAFICLFWMIIYKKRKNDSWMWF